MPSPEIVWALLLYFILPLWVLAGFADYLCHRAADIEHTSGMKETALHWILLGEMGAPLAAAVLLKINALLIGFMIACLVAHEVTSHFDIRLAAKTRRVSALEQQIHSLLEILPLTAVLLIVILYWPQALSLVGMGQEHADLSLTLKPIRNLPGLVFAAAAFIIVGMLPYVDELLRDIATARATGPTSQAQDRST